MEIRPRPIDGDQSKGHEIIILRSILTAFAAIAVSFRFLAHAVGHGSNGREDWTMLVALVSDFAVK